ncbi:MAG: DNA replication/repair protein RecF, partial [Spirochaetota bacterium]
MYIKELIINNYRNYEKLNLEFSPNNNFIIGDNGQGKTNLIESIYLLGMAKSFRISTDKDLIRKGKDYFYVKGKYYYENNEDDYLNDELHTVELGYDGKKKQAKYNGEIVKRLSDWIGNLKTVVFLKQDIDLILGSASQRRRYMDMVISLGNRNYLINLQKYMKVLKSRNKMLKEEKKIFDIYDEQLISYGSEIIYKRMKLFEEIKHDARNIFKMINPDIQNFKLDYKP